MFDAFPCLRKELSANSVLFLKGVPMFSTRASRDSPHSARTSDRELASRTLNSMITQHDKH